MLKLHFILLPMIMVACAKDQRMSMKQLSDENLDLTKQRSELSANTGKVTNGMDVPLAAKNWNADIFLVNFSAEQEEKISRAIRIIKKVIASSEFKQRVINYQFEGKRQFNDNRGLSNEQIYQKILEGAEQMGNTEGNNMMDVELELYTQATTTIGYTYPNTVRIWMNRKYFDRYTPIKVADNLMHEWMHKLGFEHATTWTEHRDHSVPYAIGYLVEELAKNYQ